MVFFASLFTIYIAQDARLRPREEQYLQFEFAKIYTRGDLNIYIALFNFLLSASLLFGAWVLLTKS